VQEDPTSHRFEALVDALGNTALSGYESAVLAHLVSWSGADDIGALSAIDQASPRRLTHRGGNQ
jgi:hypothetical protein